MVFKGGTGKRGVWANKMSFNFKGDVVTVVIVGHYKIGGQEGCEDTVESRLGMFEARPQIIDWPTTARQRAC